MPHAIRLGDASDHGGQVISAAAVKTRIQGKPPATVGDLHVCPLPGHGVTPIVEGSGRVMIEGRPAAYAGCRTGCGAALIPSQTAVEVEP